MDVWMDGWIYEWMDRWTDGWVDGWMDVWTDGRTVMLLAELSFSSIICSNLCFFSSYDMPIYMVFPKDDPIQSPNKISQ